MVSRPDSGGLAQWSLVCWLAFLSAGCASTPLPPEFAAAEDPEIASAVDRDATPVVFAVCRGYGCGQRDLVGLDGQAARAVQTLFDPPPADAAAERLAVAGAVGVIERATGQVLGTSADKPGTPLSLGDPTQMDCVDESINTSTGLHLLDRMGLLKWHQPSHPARRFAFLGFGVHYTAVLIEKDSGLAYAVDSWFHANGFPAEVVELALWRSGWKPAVTRR